MPPSAAGRPAKRTNGFVLADVSGTYSTREECAPAAFTSRLRPSAFRAVGGRRIRMVRALTQDKTLLFRLFRRRHLNLNGVNVVGLCHVHGDYSKTAVRIAGLNGSGPLRPERPWAHRLGS